MNALKKWQISDCWRLVSPSRHLQEAQGTAKHEIYRQNTNLQCNTSHVPPFLLHSTWKRTSWARVCWLVERKGTQTAEGHDWLERTSITRGEAFPESFAIRAPSFRMQWLSQAIRDIPVYKVWSERLNDSISTIVKSWACVGHVVWTQSWGTVASLLKKLCWVNFGALAACHNPSWRRQLPCLSGNFI